MTIEYFDMVGATGVVLIVVTYFLLQIGKLGSSSLTYSVTNAVGAALIIFSLVFEFNVSAFLIDWNRSLSESPQVYLSMI